MVIRRQRQFDDWFNTLPNSERRIDTQTDGRTDRQTEKRADIILHIMRYNESEILC